MGNSNIVHSKVCRAAAQPLKRLPSDGLTYGGLTGGQKVNNPSVIRRPTNPPRLQLLLVSVDVVSIDAVHLAVLGHKVRGMMFFYFFFSLRVFYTGKGFEQCFHLAGTLGLPGLFFFFLYMTVFVFLSARFIPRPGTNLSLLPSVKRCVSRQHARMCVCVFC